MYSDLIGDRGYVAIVAEHVLHYHIYRAQYGQETGNQTQLEILIDFWAIRLKLWGYVPLFCFSSPREGEAPCPVPFFKIAG